MDIYSEIYERFREFTMIPEATYIKNLEIAERLRNVPGSIIECGVWRGGMIAGIAALLGPGRDYFLFDSFNGLPPAEVVDGPAAIAWQADVNSPTYYDNCSAPVEMARQAMEVAGAASFTIIEGWFNDTLPGFVVENPIALLRLDADWYRSTMLALKHLYHHVAANGMIIIDDYYVWDGCSRAVHEFMAIEPYNRRIHQFRNELCVIAPQSFRF